MTKADIVNEITKKTGVDKVTALTVVEAFMESVKENMINGENIYLRGFGSFTLKKRAAKTARNISKNTTLIVPEHNIPAFKPAKSFNNAVAGNELQLTTDRNFDIHIKTQSYAKRKKEKKT